MTLVSDSEMAALRAVALSGMVTTVYIYNRSTEQTDDGQQTSYPASPSSTVEGWLYELTPNGATIAVLNGAEGISEMFRLLLPVGTVIYSGDKVVIGAGTYYVQHTSEDNTYLPMLTAALRKIV